MSPRDEGAPLRALAEETISWFRGVRRPGVEAELYLSRGEDRGVELRQGELEGFQTDRSEGAGLRLLRGGRMAFACAGGLSEGSLRGLFRAAEAQLDHLESDAARAFPEPAASPREESLAASLLDETLFKIPLEDFIPRLQEMEKQALARDKRLKSVLRAAYGEAKGEVFLANTLGVLSGEKGTSVSVGLSSLCEEGGEHQIGSAFQSARGAGVLDFGRVARDAAWRSTALLGSRKLPGGRRSVVFDPWVAGEVLDLISGLLAADQVQKGKSLLAGKLGQKVASELVTLIDDPRRPGGLGSSLFDDEGCPTRKKTMIDRGAVSDFFYDTYTANRDGRLGNASASRGSFKGLPGPCASNFYLTPGSGSREKLISETEDGILVLEILGMHMADPISGEFSVGVSGLAVEKGQLAQPVKGAMVSGNILDLLSRIDAVADDLTFYGSLGAPTFRVSEMTVA